ncbi:hypothetical protein [Mycobacterium avium]|uniref:Uncharacterized protein n=1 Tax=Mycobacterium avium (strain 104) TaxID=243243 RepID=A0A0H2ZXQ1_MYCA1|nr:hypothetical protein [Mycobacterium avium]ABK66768.1 hypothetical protein MAV_0259 [Mycobacterium avium 104]KDP09289.1 hypothetical protein MAV101_01305 [Mycobacterium avium subsp. hominissuis 101]MBZ4509051.1 hypothetical protein [Mycobacterium avium subsp. hominissuis]MCG3243029.1 hypothetical protein [Mycobacterium avium subsp. hominissuis]
MKKYIAPVGVAALAAATMLTGCTSAGPASAPSTSTSTPVTSAVDEVIRHVVGLGATGLDATTARGALESGRPVLVGLPQGPVVACHTALLVPGDPRPWFLNRDAVPVTGTAFETDFAQVGCSGRSVPASTTAPAPAAGMDTAAAEAAAAQGRPFIYAIPDGTNPTCNVAVIVGDEEWFLNRSGGPRAAGDALARIHDGYGCTAGEVVPGVPTTPTGN